MLNVQGLWAGRNIYCWIPAVTLGLSFSDLIQKTTHSLASYDTKAYSNIGPHDPPSSRLLQQARNAKDLI
jgi:hypothetical protein